MLALYRKYRPKTLSDVIGQEQVTKPLSSALKSGKVSHSYLFTGPRGCGKTSVARILAHEINGFKYELEDSYLDIIEIDAASNTGVDNIRELREKAIIAPSEGKYKVYIIDEVHMLTKSAFNALLKTLEEPPTHVVFILATTDLEKVPITITSRSQVYTFRLASLETMLPHLEFICKKEGIKISQPALKLIAEKGGGSFRDSLSLLDQISSLNDDKKEISESTVADCLGLPMDSKIKQLLNTYIDGDSETISDELKNLVAEGLKPESIASSCITKIITHPTPTLLPLLAELPKVSAPFPEAKLLLAFLNSSPRRGENTFSSESSSPTRTMTYIPDGTEKVASKRQSSSDSQRMRSSTKNGDSDKSIRPQALEGGDKTTYDTIKDESAESKLENSNNSKAKNAIKDAESKIDETVTARPITPPPTLTPALSQQLKKCKVLESEEQIDIYPSSKIVKKILKKACLPSCNGKRFVYNRPVVC